jgi:hypothetical protein
VDTRVRHQVGLELGKIHVEGAIETQGGSQGRHHLGHQSVKVGVGRALNVQVAAAHIVQSLVIEAEGAVGVLEQGVGRKHVVIRLNHGGGHLGSRGHGERQLGLSAVIHGQALQQQGTKTRSSTTTGGVEDHETLQTSAVIGELADAVQDQINDLLADGVVTTSVVVGGILLAGDHLLGVVKLAVSTSADLIAHSGLEIDQDGTRNVLAGTSLGEEGVEGVIATADGFVGRHLTIGLDSVLQAIKLPASVSGLDTALADMDR